MPVKLSQAAINRVNELREKVKDKDKHKPVYTSLGELNDIIKGFPRTPCLIAIIGEDKAGKSTIGKQFLFEYAQSTGMKACIYDLEETMADTADRALVMHGDEITRTDIFDLDLDPEQLNELERWANYYERYEIYVEEGFHKLKEILDNAIKEGYEVIGLDNFNLAQVFVGRDQREKLVYASQMLLEYRKKGLRIFAFSQGNADGKSFGSLQLQMDSNLCILIRRKMERVGKRLVELRGIRELVVTRSRYSGTGDMDVVFEPQFARVKSVVHEPADPKQEEFFDFEKEEEENDEYRQARFDEE